MKARSAVSALRIPAALAAAALLTAPAHAQPVDAASIVQHVDAAVAARVANVAGFTDVEHYAVFRGGGETHPAAQMTVKVTYRSGAGKSYKVLSQSGSAIVLKFGLMPLLENEKAINDPKKVDNSWFTSANYEMKLLSAATQNVNGRACYSLAITPRHKAPNMIDGTLWVDAHDFSIVQVAGIASRSPSIFAGTTRMMRRYVNIDGYPMATHARAESDSRLFGRTVVVIDYGDYHLDLRSSR